MLALTLTVGHRDRRGAPSRAACGPHPGRRDHLGRPPRVGARLFAHDHSDHARDHTRPWRRAQPVCGDQQVRLAEGCREVWAAPSARAQSVADTGRSRGGGKGEKEGRGDAGEGKNGGGGYMGERKYKGKHRDSVKGKRPKERARDEYMGDERNKNGVHVTGMVQWCRQAKGRKEEQERRRQYGRKTRAQ